MGQRTVLGLTAVLLLYFALRVLGLGWGLPPTTPEVRASDLRSSYALDEDDVLTAVSFIDPTEGRWDVRRYHWGTLHFLLLYPYMRLTFPHWRDAYYNLTPGAFERVYELARFFSVLMGAATVLLTFLLARECAGDIAGVWAALWVAVSPAHMMASTQVRVDLTMTACVVLTACLALRMRSPFWPAVAAGLAVAAKHSAIIQVAPILLIAFPSLRHIPLALAGFAAGLLAGEPYWITHGAEIVRQLRSGVAAKAADPLTILGNIIDLARFTTGIPILVLAAIGLRRLPRHHVVLAGLAGGAGIVALMQVQLLRLHVPLLPFLAVAAGVAMSRLPVSLGLAAAVMPLFACLAQLDYMRSPPPANEILPVILSSVPRGAPIARLVAEMPPLDRRVYPMAGNPLLQPPTTEWVLLTDLAEGEYPALGADYQLVADKRLPRRFAWSTLGEWGAPHDWKYTHASMTLWRRR